MKCHQFRLRRRHYYRLLVVLLICFTVALVVNELASPVHGRPTNSGIKLPSKHLAKTTPLPSSSLDNDYFQLSLPTGYRQQQASQAVPGLLYGQTIIKPANFGSLIITIGVKLLPEGGTTEDSSYRLRSQQTEHYHLMSQEIAADQVMIWNDTQTAAMVAFWPHNSYLATISVKTGSDEPSSGDNKNLLDVLHVLLDAWQWK